MKDVKDVRACVIDHGLFGHIAQCLASTLDHVFYCGPTERVMSKLGDALVGNGFDNITRVESVWEVKNDCDLFVFPDIGFNGEQKELLSQGLPVFGHHGADVLEVYKGAFLKTLEQLGMEVPPHTIIKGMAALKEHLLDKEDKWIKIDKYRGDWETLHFRNWLLDEATLDCYSYRLGPVKNKITFYVFDKIETEIEDGIDTMRVNGQWPKRVLHAMERKDSALIGAIQNFSDIAEPIREVNEQFGPALDEYGMLGPFSTEVRVTEDGKAILNDPTIRFGSPPSQLQTVLITNLPEIIWAAANGEIVEPENSEGEEIGAQVLITTDKEKDEWCTFDMPEELRPFVKSAFSCEAGGILRICPNPLENWAGWLIATGRTIKEVVESLQEMKTLLPDGFDCDITCLADLLKELDEAQEHGIEITDTTLPEPEIVLTNGD